MKTSTSTSTSFPKSQPVIFSDDESEELGQLSISEAPADAEEFAINDKFFDNVPYGARLTGADKLRAEGLTGKGVKVAVIDTGVDSEHPGFHGMVTKQYWFRHSAPLKNHGTLVAGTVHMMAPEAEIIDCRVYGGEGKGIFDAIESSMMMAADDGCDVINMSLGSKNPNVKIGRGIQYARSKGVHIVVAAGNGGDGDPLTNEESYPAMRPEVLSIASVDKNDGNPVSKFSNSNVQVDYAAIGRKVNTLKPGGEYTTASGTSLAAPHVAGLLAALLTKDGPYRAAVTDDESLRKLLEQFTIDIGVKGPDNATGLGFLTYLNEEEYKKLESETKMKDRKNFVP